MRILKETELRKVKVLGSGAFGTVYKVRGGAKVQGGRLQRMHQVWPRVLLGKAAKNWRRQWCLVGQLQRLGQGIREWIVGLNNKVVAN